MKFWRNIQTCTNPNPNPSSFISILYPSTVWNPGRSPQIRHQHRTPGIHQSVGVIFSVTNSKRWQFLSFLPARVIRCSVKVARLDSGGRSFLPEYLGSKMFYVIYQTWDAVFHHQMKHREESWKYDAQRSIFDELRGVSSGDETLCRMFDISSQTKSFLKEKLRMQILSSVSSDFQTLIKH